MINKKYPEVITIYELRGEELYESRLSQISCSNRRCLDATFESHTSLKFFQAFLFATAKVASITLMIYFHIKNIP